jgi:transposase
MVAVAIRRDRTPEELRALARRERDGRVCSRLLALANALDGMSRAAAARLAGMDRQTLRDWVHRYNAQGVEGLKDRPRRGRPPRLDDGQQAALKALVLRGPKLERDGYVTWRLRDLCAVV